MYMATLHKIRSEKNKYVIFIKGAPERILDLVQIGQEQKLKIKKEFEE
ncbi:unnamed protein product, partial [marine sediment metagenome]